MTPRAPKLVIITGLPGSGKSTLAREDYPHHLHYEPDHFFCDTQGRYRFDAQLWDEACTWCWTMTDFALARGENVVVTDVFATRASLDPYRQLAEAHGATLDVIHLESQHRNSHRVPVTVLRRMKALMDGSGAEAASRAAELTILRRMKARMDAAGGLPDNLTQEDR